MSYNNLNELLDAVEVSPQNGPLRYYLAETLLGYQWWLHAANQYLAALRLEDVSVDKARFGLAQALLNLDKLDEAIALVESLLDTELSIPTSPVHLLHARLLLQTGEYSLAVDEYSRAIDGDPHLIDPDLAEALGMDELSAYEDADEDAHEDGDSQAKPIADTEVNQILDDLNDWIANL